MPLPSEVLSPSASTAEPELPGTPQQSASLSSLSPAQAADWLVSQLNAVGGAEASSSDLTILLMELEVHAEEWSPAQLQAMGRAVGKVFMGASGARALSGELGYAALDRLLREWFLSSQPSLSPPQLGALFGGIRSCLKPGLPGADARFLRVLSDAVQKGVSPDHRVAMACGFYRASRSSPNEAYSPVKLTIAVPHTRRQDVQDTLNWGRRLAADPMSFYDSGVIAPADKRFAWVKTALEMPEVPNPAAKPRARPAQLQRANQAMSAAEKQKFLPLYQAAKKQPTSVERKGK